MKHIRIVIAALMLILPSLPAYSWQLGLGLTSYYSDWTPEFIGQHDDVNIEPALLGGFALSFRFYERFVLSGQGMFTFLEHTADYNINVDGATPHSLNINTNYKREETDVSLMYILNENFSVFAGYKRLNFDLIELNNAEATPSYQVFSGEFYNQFHIQGPGAGISYKIPLGENLNASVSTSLIYFFMKYYGYIPVDTGFEINIANSEYTYNGLGNNTTLVLSYIFDSISTAINLGARCQVIKYLDTGDAPKLDYDLNYGLTLSALYFL